MTQLVRLDEDYLKSPDPPLADVEVAEEKRLLHLSHESPCNPLAAQRRWRAATWRDSRAERTGHRIVEVGTICRTRTVYRVTSFDLDPFGGPMQRALP